MSLENTASDNDVEQQEFVDELKPDTQLMHGQYTIETFLAAGGFGITYLARDSLNRRVVIKECFPGNFCRRQNASVLPRSRAHQSELTSIVRLFSQEAMSLAKASHPNIVGVHQVFEENNTSYMALDFVQGQDLLEILKENPEQLTPELVEGYLEKVLGAVQHIHDLGMLHRDISPDNIIINEAGEPILIDFGAAREETSSDEKVTRMLSALRVVKDGYSPQEFYIAGSLQTPSCDLYSLAASFYHIITQEMPPDSQARLQARAAEEADPYISLGDKVDGYSASFVSALDKAMNILPNERMQSADEWLAHMKNAAPVKSVLTSTSFASVANTNSFPTTPVLFGSAAVVALLAGIAFSTLTGSDAPENITDEVATLPNVAVATGSPDLELPATNTAPATRDSSGLDVAAADLQDAQPGVDTTEPADTFAGTSVATDTSAVDFFTSQPDLISAQRQSAQAASDTTPRAQLNTLDTSPASSAITGGFAAVEPFMLSDSEPGVIVAAAAADLSTEARIISINGAPVDSNAQIFERLNTLAAGDDAETFDVVFGLDTDGTRTEQQVTIAKEQRTSLSNGLTFVARPDGDAWTTEVVSAPSGSNLLVGDTLVSYSATWEEVNGPSTLRTILERELEKGTSSFSFAVRRDGEIWVEDFELSS